MAAVYSVRTYFLIAKSVKWKAPNRAASNVGLGMGLLRKRLQYPQQTYVNFVITSYQIVRYAPSRQRIK